MQTVAPTTPKSPKYNISNNHISYFSSPPFSSSTFNPSLSFFSSSIFIFFVYFSSYPPLNPVYANS